MNDNQLAAAADFKHTLFYLNCLVAAVALAFIAVLESQPNIFEQLMESVRLIDAIIFAAFGLWARTGRVLAPFMLFPYCIYLIFDQRMADSSYQYAAIGVYVAVMIMAAISLHASWQIATQEPETITEDQTDSAKQS
ncbi:hypothetical protein [Candidatus Albibeggiatoa sp. nov. NOAA]|uniref:hypothetical protein n=1 Tax=Candidatus Albibeggiatoa sp. nov. NOAA TaxID=3162724 RepID=UPI003300BBB7|nr:hypothetical protein [Thiotrichaceae bacterium]